MSRALAIPILLLLVQGCHRKSAPPPAKADAAVVAPPSAPWTASVVAQMLGEPEWLEWLDDDGLLLRERYGLFVYTIDPHGTLTRIGAPADYAPFFLRTGIDDELIGYEPTTLPDPLFDITAFSGRASGSSARPFLRAVDTEVRRGRAPIVTWNGAAWIQADKAPPPDVRTIHGQTEIVRGVGLPPDYSWGGGQLTKSAVVWLGQSLTRTEYTVTAVAPSRDAPAHIVDVPDPHVFDGGTTNERLCAVLASADDGTYIRCSFLSRGQHRKVERFFHLEADRWEPIGASFEVRRENRGSMPEAVVDAEGGVWYSAEDTPTMHRVIRTSDDTFELPRMKLGDASYDTQMPRDRPEDGKLWRPTIITDPSPSKLSEVRTLVARRSGDVWAISGGLLVRFARGGEAKPVLIRSGADERNEVMNTRGLRAWTSTGAGHCNSVFVPLDEASYAKNESALRAAVAGVKGLLIDVAVVRGSLAGRPVMGVVFLRSQPTAPLATMEAAVKRVIKLAAKDAPSPPEVTCSLPVLDRVVAHLNVLPEDF